MGPNEGIILQVQHSLSEYPYRLGNISITFKNTEENLTSEFSVQFQTDSTCYFLLEETNEEGESQRKVLQAFYETPFDILYYLSSLKIFHFVINSEVLKAGENIIKVCLDPSKFISLDYQSDPFYSHYSRQVFKILQYFLNIKFDEYEEDYLYGAEQVTKIYNCISNSYDPKVTECSITHPSLIPKLRPYQCQAVSWMLKCENGKSSRTSEKYLHDLYTTISLQDGHIVYFHKYRGLFVKQKFQPESPCKGGILADEVGLGKTLEVLACILLNPRNCMEIPNKKDLLPSRATLIIAPASIIYQWEQEILKHINKSCLKVFMYFGERYVHPSSLADHDIVLVSYETLRKELNLVDVPYGSSGISLMHCKRFIYISPLCFVHWWRVCLDEAQMVESICSKIAGKLLSVNRWCVSGSPINKSVEDLYGLLVFLNVDPYQQKMWWKEVILKPFVNGNFEPLSSVLKDIAWRTMKHQVFDQVGMPEVKEVSHKVEFSSIERVYYLKQHSLCNIDFMKEINNFDLNKKLCSLEGHFLSKVMIPLQKLQLVCCYFPIACENIEVQKLRKMSTTEILVHLLKTTKYECEVVHRKLITAMNGLAGIYVIRKDYANAVETFEKVLDSIEDNKQKLTTDITQHILASYHLSQILSVTEKEGKNINSKFMSEDLAAKVEELGQSFRVTLDCIKKSNELNDEISEIMSMLKLKSSQSPVSLWFAILESMTLEKLEEVLGKVRDLLESAPGKSYLQTEILISKRFSVLTFPLFVRKVLNLSEDLYETRHKLKNKMNEISSEPSISVVNSVISCHFRPVSKSPKCIYCEAEDIFQSYEAKLFRFDESNATSGTNTEEAVCFQKARRGTHADSHLELVLKFSLNYLRFEGPSVCKDFERITDCIEDVANELKLIDAFKKEFKVLSLVWKKCFDHVSQRDEVAMAKIAPRVLFPGETPPNPPVSYILLPHEVETKQVQYHSVIIARQFQLKEKLGQLFYLQNLEKAENKNAPFEESCPICQQIFECSWSVLQCGHCVCLLCTEQLLSSKRDFTNRLGFISNGICCPLCRQFSAASDVYFIENKKDEEAQESILVKGFYSKKANAVVKCLLQIKKKNPEAKSLVFSSFTYFLFIIENGLTENGIKFFNLCKRRRFKEELEEFKQSKDINTLLIPLNFECNGLNITEATNVLLVEPVLDNSKHLQAIETVNRIGQKKTVTIHRFVVRKTIEESIYDVMKKLSTEEKHKQTDLTLQSLKDIFKEA